MESRVDFFRLRTGERFSLPFDGLVLFSTNLNPAELMDAAFLRPYFTRNPVVEQPRPDIQATVPSPAQLFGERHARPPAQLGRNSHISSTGPMPGSWSSRITRGS